MNMKRSLVFPVNYELAGLSGPSSPPRTVRRVIPSSMLPDSDSDTSNTTSTDYSSDDLELLSGSELSSDTENYEKKNRKKWKVHEPRTDTTFLTEICCSQQCFSQFSSQEFIAHERMHKVS